MPRSLKQIERELAAVNGQLEWATKWGIGISFSSIGPDDGLNRIPNALTHAAWIDLSDTGITDSVLAHLNGCPRLESVGLVGTQVTAKGIQQLLTSSPSIQQIELSISQLGSTDIAEIREKWPDLAIAWYEHRNLRKSWLQKDNSD